MDDNTKPKKIYVPDKKSEDKGVKTTTAKSISGLEIDIADYKPSNIAGSAGGPGIKSSDL